VDFAGKGQRVSKDSTPVVVVCEWFSFLLLLAIIISQMFLIPSRASPSFACEKKLKFIFHVR